MADRLLPPVPKPMAAYEPFLRCDGLVFTAGMTPRREGRLVVHGRVGDEVDLATARAAAGLAASNALSAAAAGAGGLAEISRLLRLTVFVAAAPGFTDLAAVAEGATETLAALLGSGERADAALTVAGVRSLPGGAPVEVELVAACRAD